MAALVRTTVRITRATLAILLPVGTLLACVGLLLLGVHVASQPVARLARVLLDVVDAGADAAGRWLVEQWASLWGWSTSARDATVESWMAWVDIPEKLAAVHVVGLVLEGMLLLAFLPLAWHADPYEAAWQRPTRMWAALRAWFVALGPWARVERVLLIPVLVAGGSSLAQLVRVQVVAEASGGYGLPLETLSSLGLAAALVTAWLVAWFAALPMVVVEGARTARASRTRRLWCLVCAVLVCVSAVQGWLA